MAKAFQGINGVAMKENRPLFRHELMEVVPSIFAVEAHESRSERFAPVATIQVVDRLEAEGYFPFYAIQTKVRDESKRDFTKHMLRFRKDIKKNDGTADEIILVNANDGTSAYNLMAGQFRFVCCNGLVMGNTVSNTKIYHKGSNIMDDVIEGVYSVVDGFDEINRHQAEMGRILLPEGERKSMALAAYVMKEGMPEDMNFNNLKYDPVQLLKTHNTTDDGSKTLLSTFNVLQENLVGKGGQTGFSSTGRRTRSRAITNIDKNIQVNSQLWDLAKHIMMEKQ